MVVCVVVVDRVREKSRRKPIVKPFLRDFFETKG